MMKIRTSQDGQKLFVKEISGDHNHELSEVLILLLYMHGCQHKLGKPHPYRPDEKGSTVC